MATTTFTHLLRRFAGTASRRRALDRRLSQTYSIPAARSFFRHRSAAMCTSRRNQLLLFIATVALIAVGQALLEPRPRPRAAASAQPARHHRHNRSSSGPGSGSRRGRGAGAVVQQQQQQESHLEQVLGHLQSVHSGVAEHAARVASNVYPANLQQAFVSGMDIAKWHLTRGLAHANHHTTRALQKLQVVPRVGGSRRGRAGTTLSGAALAEFEKHNDAALEAVLQVIDSTGWEEVASKHGITVLRKHIDPSEHGGGGAGEGVVNEAAAAKFACVMARGTLAARAADLFALFESNDRVHEYNDNCAEVKDLEAVSQDCKVTWARTPRFGPFKARDFVTVVNYRKLPDGTLAVVNRPVAHAKAPASNNFVRAEILIATNMMRPNSDDPNKTDFVTIAHINPGGIVDSPLGANIVNMLCAQAPVKLLMSLERAAKTPATH